MKKILTTLLRVLISFGAIGLILYLMQDKLADSWSILKSDVNWFWFVLAIITFVVANTIIGFRLQLLFKIHNLHLTSLRCFYLSFLGLFFNLLLPSAIGGDVAKIYFAAKHTGKKVESTSCVVQDRMVGFMSIMIIAIFAVIFFSKEIADPRVNLLIYVFAGIMILAFCFIWSRRFARLFQFFHILIPGEKIKGLLKDLYDVLYDFKYHTGGILRALTYSFASQFCFILVYYFLTQSLDVDISIGLFCLFVPVISIVSMMPSLGGLGVREAGFIFFMKNYMPSEKALVVSILLFAVIYGVSIVSGIVYAFKGGLKEHIPQP